MIAEVFERYTINDYKQWKGDWELIGGIAYAMAPSPISKHQAILAKLARLFDEIIENCPNCFVLVEEDYIISKDTVVRPDLCIVCKDPIATNITKAPKLIVEIVSDSSAFKDENIKFALYEKEKVLYYILVYPDEFFAKVYKLKNDKFDKVGDFTDEKVFIEVDDCKGEIDFNKAFKKLKNYLKSISKISSR